MHFIDHATSHSTWVIEHRAKVQTYATRRQRRVYWEVSCSAYRRLANYVLVGHSERRQYFNEDDACLIRKKFAMPCT